MEVHPELGDTTTRPDFQVSRDGETLLLEATTTFSGIIEEGRSDDRERWIKAAIDKVESPNFHVRLEFERVGMERPADREITEPLERWLAELDPDEVNQAGFANAPELRLEFRDWEIVLSPIAIKPEARGRPDNRTLGMGPMLSGYVNDVEKLQRSLRRKARKYGVPDEPLVIAILSMSRPADEDVEQALLGRLAWQFDPQNPGNGRWVRQTNGLWLQGDGPHATKVSAAIVGVSLMPWDVARVWPRLWCNPWATRPLQASLPFPAGVPDRNGGVGHEEAEGLPHSVLGLPEDWPGPEDRFERLGAT